MSTVSEIIQWLKTLPEDAEVQCGVEGTCCGSTYMTYSSVDIQWSEIIDYSASSDRFRYPETAGKTIVRLRGE